MHKLYQPQSTSGQHYKSTTDLYTMLKEVTSLASWCHTLSRILTLPSNMGSHTHHRTWQGLLEQYACVLQDGFVQLASKIYAEIDKPVADAAVGDYLIEEEHSRIGELEGIEYNVELAGCYRPLLDGKGVKKFDFLDVRYVSLMLTDADFVSR